MTKTKLIIDTDIGTDPDDVFALAYAIKNPNANVKAITTVQGIPITRAKIAKKIEDILGVDIPITAGKKGPKPLDWLGNFEKQALTPEELRKPFENRPFPKYDKKTKLVAIGSLTNIAYQLENNPSIKNITDIYIMGSSESSHNFKVDPEATAKVFEQPWNIWQITKKDSLKIYFTKKELKALQGTELGNFLCESGLRGMKYMKRQNSAMYDVLVVSSAIGEDYVKFKQTAPNRYISDNVNPKLKNKITGIILGED